MKTRWVSDLKPWHNEELFGCFLRRQSEGVVLCSQMERDILKLFSAVFAFASLSNISELIYFLIVYLASLAKMLFFTQTIDFVFTGPANIFLQYFLSPSRKIMVRP